MELKEKKKVHRDNVLRSDNDLEHFNCKSLVFD